MSLYFPSSPTVNQEVAQNGRTWRWSGYAWQIVANVAGHASTHGSAGSDPVTLAISQVTGLQAAIDGKAASSKTLLRFAATQNQPPASAFAQLDTRNSIAVIAFDAATQEDAVFVGTIPDGAVLTSGLVVRLWWMAASATSGNVRWQVQVEADGTDNDADSFDAATAATAAANGTSGIETVTDITATAIDSLTAGKRFRLKVARVAADAADTMTGDAQLIAVEVRVP